MRASLTDAFIRKLPPADTPYIVRDEDVKGFYVIVSKGRVAYFIQKDTNHQGRRRTIKKRIGIFGKTTTSDARKVAKAELSKIENRAVVPLAGSVTLRQAWERYRERHLKRKEKTPRTLDWYRDQIERVHADWLDVALAKLGDDPERVMARHEELAKKRVAEIAFGDKKFEREVGGKSAANQAMRAFRAVYRFARDSDRTLPELRRFNFLFREKRRSTAIKDLAAWWRQLYAMDEGKDVRRCFHALLLLSGSRPTALAEARWGDLNVPERRLHIRNPKGGEGRAFDIPLSFCMLRWLVKARRAAIKEAKGEQTSWIFPSSLSESGHIEEHKERRSVLAHWGGDLRQTYRTVADGRATQLQVKLLLNHTLNDDVTDGYADKGLMWSALVDAQRRISAALTT